MPQLIRPKAGGPTMSSKEEEWEDLYERLLDVLSEFGENCFSGEQCDYLLVADEYGSRHHKIEVVNPDFWSDTIHQRIRALLQTAFPSWGVFVVFGERASGRRGFIIYADRVEFDPMPASANAN